MASKLVIRNFIEAFSFCSCCCSCCCFCCIVVSSNICFSIVVGSVFCGEIEIWDVGLMDRLLFFVFCFLVVLIFGLRCDLIVLLLFLGCAVV